MNRQDAKNAKKIVEMRKKQKVYFHLGVLRAFAVFFFNSLRKEMNRSYLFLLDNPRRVRSSTDKVGSVEL